MLDGVHIRTKATAKLGGMVGTWIYDRRSTYSCKVHCCYLSDWGHVGSWIHDRRSSCSCKGSILLPFRLRAWLLLDFMINGVHIAAKATATLNLWSTTYIFLQSLLLLPVRLGACLFLNSWSTDFQIWAWHDWYLISWQCVIGTNYIRVKITRILWILRNIYVTFLLFSFVSFSPNRNCLCHLHKSPNAIKNYNFRGAPCESTYSIWLDF